MAMTTVQIIAAWAVFIGLLLTAIGAAITANAVIISDQQADNIAATKFDLNTALKASLLEQSRSARRGLWIIFAGTALQLVGTGLPLFF
jgi:hypothetical protein